MNDQPSIRGDIPISVHPGALAPNAPTLTGEKMAGTPGPSAFAAGSEALGAVYTFLGAVEDAEKAMQAASPKAIRRQRPDGRSDYLGDLRLTDGRLRSFPDQVEEFKEAVHRSFERVALTVDRRVKELDGYLDTLDKQVTHALTDPNGRSAEGIAVATEIRAHVKGLAKGKRFSFVTEAIGNGDLPTVAAAINGPAFLSGLTPEEQGQLRVLAAQKFAPVAHAQRSAVLKVKETVTVAGSHLTTRHAKAMRIAETPRGKAVKTISKLGEVGK